MVQLILDERDLGEPIALPVEDAGIVEQPRMEDSRQMKKRSVERDTPRD